VTSLIEWRWASQAAILCLIRSETLLHWDYSYIGTSTIQIDQAAIAAEEIIKHYQSQGENFHENLLCLLINIIPIIALVLI